MLSLKSPGLFSTGAERPPLTSPPISSRLTTHTTPAETTICPQVKLQHVDTGQARISESPPRATVPCTDDWAAATSLSSVPFSHRRSAVRTCHATNYPVLMLRRVEAQQLTALLLSNCAISWYYAGMTTYHHDCTRRHRIHWWLLVKLSTVRQPLADASPPLATFQLQRSCQPVSTKNIGT